MQLVHNCMGLYCADLMHTKVGRRKGRVRVGRGEREGPKERGRWRREREREKGVEGNVYY